MNNWEKFKWLVEQVKQMKKKSAPFATLGVKLILGALTLFSIGGIAFYILLPPEFYINEIKYTNNEISTYSLNIGLFIILMGILMILFEAYNYRKARKTSKIIINGMKNGFNKFPIEILSYEEKNNSRDTINIGMIEEVDNLAKQIQYYNSEKQIDLYNRFIFNDEVENLYICGISRVPFLVAYGACLKGNVSVKYIEREHSTNKSFFLDDVNQKINIIKMNEQIELSEDGDIGIAIGFTSKIHKEHLPKKLKEHTLFIKPSLEEDRLLIKNQDNLIEIVKKIQKIIDGYSSNSLCKKIHLFLSIQTSFAIELGRHFQEGIHKNWVIHNFDGSEGEYSWALEISKDFLKKYEENEHI